MIRATRAAAVEALAAILGRFGGTPAQARGWAESSPLADTAEVVAGHFRAWRAAGAEEAIIDQPCPLDDETIERLAGFAGRDWHDRTAAPSATAIADSNCGPAGRRRRLPGACCRLRG